jgi:signal transduction histidine kinase
MPLSAGALSLALLGTLLLTTHRHDVREHEREFGSDVDSAIQSLRFRLHADEAYLTLLASEYARDSIDADTFWDTVTQVILEIPELEGVAWLEHDLVLTRQVGTGPTGLPNDLSAKNREAAGARTSLFRGASYTWFCSNTDGESLLCLYSPMLVGERVVGGIVASYHCRTLLERAVPLRLLQGNAVALVDGDGRDVASSQDARQLDPNLSRMVDLTPLGYQIKIRVTRYASAFLEARVWLLVLLCVVLACAMAYWMWALSREAAQRRCAQEFLQKEHDNLVNVLEAMEDGVAIVSPHLDVQYVNPVLVKDFGSYQGRKCYEYFHGQVQRCDWCMMDDVIAGRSVHTQWCYPRNGRTYDLIDTRVTNPDGSVSKLKIFHDVTERERAAAEVASRLAAERAAKEEARLRLEEVESLQRVTTALLDRVTLDEVLEVVCSEAQLLTNATGSSVLLLDGDDFWVTKTTGTPRPRTRRMAVAQSFAGVAAERGTTTLMPDTGRDDLNCYREPRPASLLAAPLRVGGHVIGVLDVAGGHTAFKEHSVRILSHIADQAAVAIEKAKLRQQAERVAVMEERHRVARQLHDSLTQALYSLSLFADASRLALDGGKTKVVHDHLVEMRTLAKQALLEMRLLIFELHPPALESEGLIGAVRTRLATVETRAGLETEVLVEGDERRLSPQIEEALYGFSQEALNNVVKHAAAKTVSIRVSFCDDIVRLEVRDDGAGFDLHAAGRCGGLGLKGMRERIDRAGGNLEIITRAGQGTCMAAAFEVNGDEYSVARDSLASARPSLGC